MPTQYIKRYATTGPGATSGKPHASPIYVDSDDNILKIIPASSGTTEVQVIDASSVQTLTNKTITGAIVTSAPISPAAASYSITAALNAGRTQLNDRVGGVAWSLPAATGTGNVYRFVNSVATTGASVNTWITVPATDLLSGGILVNDTGGSAAATADFHPATAASSNKLSSVAVADGEGAGIGDWVEFQDIASAKWVVRGVWAGSIDPTNPFSAV